MPLNPNIALSTQTATPVSKFNESRRQNELLDLSVASGQRQQTEFDQEQQASAEQAKTIERFRGVETAVKGLSPILDNALASGNTDELMAALQTRRQGLIDEGTETSDTDIAIQAVQSGNLTGARQLFDQVLSQGQELDRMGLGLPQRQQVSDPAGQREFENLIADFTPEEQDIARRVEAGLQARAGTVTGLERRSTDPTLGGAVSDQQAREAAAKETGKLSAQLQLKPEVDAAVNTAVARATLAANEVGENRSNQRTLQIYDVAITELAQSLGNTVTGPVAGLMPAITANQQIADGAVAAIAPVLKQLFRSAGEGIFTDKDQELLLAMVPGRSDQPAARAAKLRNIDAIVRAKLTPLSDIDGGTAQPADASTGPVAPEGTVITDAQGQSFIKQNGQWVPNG